MAVPTALANNKIAALWTYRHLLRATYIAFKGDHGTLQASRKFARDSFDKYRDLDLDSVKFAQAVEHAQAVTKILRENVVQGEQAEGDSDRYKLNIHEHTQRLDNDTAGNLKGTKKSFQEIKSAIF